MLHRLHGTGTAVSFARAKGAVAGFSSHLVLLAGDAAALPPALPCSGCHRQPQWVPVVSGPLPLAVVPSYPPWRCQVTIRERPIQCCPGKRSRSGRKVLRASSPGWSLGAGTAKIEPRNFPTTRLGSPDGETAAHVCPRPPYPLGGEEATLPPSQATLAAPPSDQGLPGRAAET